MTHSTWLSARLFGCTLALAPSLGWAWGPQGHQTVGAIADQLIAGTPAEQQVKALLGGITLSNASVWADCVKGVSSADGVNFRYTVARNANGSARYPECTQFETPEESARQIGFVSRNWKQCGAAHDREFCHNQYHYTDVSDLRDHYEETFAGANTHDIVHSINAAIAVLRGERPAAPFQIADKREALLILSHYVGDIHQPLHVAAAYLDGRGRNVDPDDSGLDPKTDTNGGNLIFDRSRRFHAEWDDIPDFLAVGGSGFSNEVTKARAVLPTTGDMGTWSTQWATDTIASGPLAFKGLRFVPKQGSTPGWTVNGIDATYRGHADVLKGDQLAKAGARLAQVLEIVWPEGSNTSTPPSATLTCPSPSTARGYLATADLPDATAWLPPAPGAPVSPSDPVAQAVVAASQASDDAVIRQTRAGLHGPRGQQAAKDDVFSPEEVALRFKDALGVTLNRRNAPQLMGLIEKAQADGSELIAPVKRSVAQGGRARPFVADPSLETCLSPVDMAGQRHNDLDCFHLAESGSYPSTHALVGMFLGMLFTDLAPDRAAPMLSWGLGFGDSRVVCGFHYPSDVAAGRLAASALWARLMANPAFNRDLEAARQEVQNARGR